MRRSHSRPRLSTAALAAAAWLGAAGLSAPAAFGFEGPAKPAPSLDAELLEQLTEGLDLRDSPKPADPAPKAPAVDEPATTRPERGKPEPSRPDRERPAGRPTAEPADAGEPGEVAPPKPLVEPSRAGSSNDELDRRLLDELKPEAGNDAGEGEAIAMIRERMEEARRRIDAAESGEEVQSLQKQIVDDLAKLLKMKQCQCQSQCQNPSASSKPGSPKPGSKPGENGGKKPGEKKPGEEGKKPEGEQNGEPKNGDGENKKPKDSDESIREMKPADAMAFDQLANFLQAEWGHLPEREREQVIQAFKEKFLPQYDQMIRDYYERLAAGREAESR